MEPLFAQLGRLPAAFKALGRGTKVALALCALALAGALSLVAVMGPGQSGYQYAFTNLSGDDGTQAGELLKGAGVPFRLEAGGTALAVPQERVYEARLLLASAGLPRAGGVGFELFDKGDLGMSEFTQKVNLRRATEGELARTISRLSEVRAARVHLTLSERGLFRDEEKKAAAAVVLDLQPGRALTARQVQGIRHLVSSAVPGLAAQAVTVVDGHGAVLTEGTGYDEEGAGYQARLERDLEQRVVSLLEPAVGQGNVVARVSATMDLSEVTSRADVVDPDQVALKSERTVNATQAQTQSAAGGVAGAAANVPLNAAQAQAQAAGPSSNGSSQDESRDYEVSRTTTTTVAKVPRLTKLSLAVLLAAPKEGRPDAELARLGELAKRTVGFDEARGDQFELTSVPFTVAQADAEEKPAVPAAPPPWQKYLVPGAVVLAVLLLLVGFALARRKAPSDLQAELKRLKPGVRLAELEAGADAEGAGQEQTPRALPDPAADVRERARVLAASDPAKAALLVKGWLAKEHGHG